MKCFLPIITILLCSTIQASKGGGTCHSSGSDYTGRGDCFSGFGGGHCASPCVGGGYSAGDHESHGGGGSFGSSSGGNGGGGNGGASAGFSCSGVAGAGLQAGKQAVLNECYLVTSGPTVIKACKKQDILFAVDTLMSWNAQVQAGNFTYDDVHAMTMSYINNTHIPLDCALARPAPEALQGMCHDLLNAQAREAQARSQALYARLGIVMQGYNEVIAGKKTPAQAKQALATAMAQGVPLQAVRDVVVKNAQKAKKSIDHDVDERLKQLSQPKMVPLILLHRATNCLYHYWGLDQHERDYFVNLYGSHRWAIRAIELATNRCAQGWAHHICYASPINQAQLPRLDAMTDQEVEAHLKRGREAIANLM